MGKKRPVFLLHILFRESFKILVLHIIQFNISRGRSIEKLNKGFSGCQWKHRAFQYPGRLFARYFALVSE